MKKINSLSKLQGKIDNEIYWRKVELTAIKFDAEAARLKNIKDQERTIKYGLMLLYSHWEGAIKNIAEYYLIYVSSLQLTFGDLLPNFLAIVLRKDYTRTIKGNKITPYNSLIDDVFLKQEENSIIPTDKIISANSNLNSDVFKEIMGVIGLPITSYESRFIQLDSKLLQNRNFIAHGDRFERLEGISNIDEYLEIHEAIFGMINLFAEEVYKSASEEKYLKTQS